MCFFITFHFIALDFSSFRKMKIERAAFLSMFICTDALITEVQTTNTSSVYCAALFGPSLCVGHGDGIVMVCAHE
jgi:hypothetical protein